MQFEPFLFLYITEKCQLRCKHCYMGDRLERESYMSLEMISDILRTLKSLYGQYKVYLLGGEPTLHPKFNEVIDVCRSHEYKVVVTSNGMVPERTWTTLRSNLVDSLSFSLDGATAETHDFMRGRNSFANLTKSITKAVQLGIQTRVIYTVSRRNVDEALQAVTMAESHGISMISFHYFTPTGLGRDKPELQLSPEEWRSFTQELRDMAGKTQIQIYYPPAFVDATEIPAIRELGYRGCTARNLERLAIFPDGRVYICSMFFDTDLHYGTFERGRIVPVQRQSTAGELDLVSHVPDNCFSCSNVSSCQAGCAAYDYFEGARPTSNCDRQLMPVCPLWSMPATPDRTLQSLTDLR
ncbi:MAG: radical SAM protein [Rhodocyclaceae bacterium]|nr:radical SAM protein [Rhodocyclaceae bacterium]